MRPGRASHELRRGPLVWRSWSGEMPMGGDEDMGMSCCRVSLDPY